MNRPSQLVIVVSIAAIAALPACSHARERAHATICEFDADSRGAMPDRARLLGASGLERRHTLRERQADLLAKVPEHGGKLRGFEVNLFLGDFGEPALIEALQHGPLRIRVEQTLLDRAKAGTAAGAEVRVRIGPESHFEQLDVEVP
ncbi:MAG: hypothetical protein HYR85_07635 [Planctomycetes bacterium]|nr:hypothetical protein [Planctomycetota bacterium]